MRKRIDEVLSELREIRDRVDYLIQELSEEEYAETIKRLLYGTDLEILAPYFIQFIRIDKSTLNKLKEGIHCSKSDWLWANRILPILEINSKKILVCPLPDDMINGVHSEFFPQACLNELFNFLAQREEIAQAFQAYITSVVDSAELRRKYKISNAQLEDFNINEHTQLKKDLISKYYAAIR